MYNDDDVHACWEGGGGFALLVVKGGVCTVSAGLSVTMIYLFLLEGA